MMNPNLWRDELKDLRDELIHSSSDAAENLSLRSQIIFYTPLTVESSNHYRCHCLWNRRPSAQVMSHRSHSNCHNYFYLSGPSYRLF
ncbi:hypothetical protein ACMD2_11962 [Ananas comosus]|uniref:Uncharacterized protein n=1 Tax=Ananas comosus TaxID=4615 RepID=A0A199VFW9_ANACO|nr:hypothetical protein ACMD2_11962 [Ananas comosus]